MAEAAASTPPPIPAAAPPTAAAPPMAATPMPMAAPPQPMPSSMADGGETSAPKSSVKDFFADVDILDVTISAFIVGAVLYSVHYYKFMMMMEKTGYADLNGRMAKLENAMAKKAAAEANANGGRKQRRPVMRIS
jgi:PHD/YefM family antitoxin component YafN of YafNO toxin-antitoxin module